jgi:hypothetical protein
MEITLPTGEQVRYWLLSHALGGGDGEMHEIHAEVLATDEKEPILQADFIATICGGFESWGDFIYAAGACTERLLFAAERIAHTCALRPNALRRIGNILEVARLELRSDARGNGVGLSLGKQLLDYFTADMGTAVVLLSPFPLQFEGVRQRTPIEHLEATQNALQQATDKLKAHYTKSWGAMQVGDTGLMVIPVNGVGIATIGESWLPLKEEC